MKNLKSFFIKNTLVLTSTALLFTLNLWLVLQKVEDVKTVENDNVEFNELLKGRGYCWKFYLEMMKDLKCFWMSKV
ncbi:hypothetical protein ACVPOS_17340 [Staphylococcus aureus]